MYNTYNIRSSGMLCGVGFLCECITGELVPEVHLGGTLKSLIGPIRYANEMNVSLFLSSNLCFVLTTERNKQGVEGTGRLFPLFCGLQVNIGPGVA